MPIELLRKWELYVLSWLNSLDDVAILQENIRCKVVIGGCLDSNDGSLSRDRWTCFFDLPLFGRLDGRWDCWRVMAALLRLGSPWTTRGIANSS